MRMRLSLSVALLFALLFSTLVMGAPEFAVPEARTLNLNPMDRDILVHRVAVDDVSQPIRIKELTVLNRGTASANELEEITVRFRKEGESPRSVSLTNLSGIESGITFSLPDGGLTLREGELGQFELFASVRGPERVPVSKYGRNVSIRLGAQFHYVHLEDGGLAEESVSSRWVEDPEANRIVRGGFEIVETLPLETDLIQPGTTATIGLFRFKDEDANQFGVEVDTIVIDNRSTVPDPLVLGEDITELHLKLTIVEDGEVRVQTASKSVTTPTSEVTFTTGPDAWWDGKCLDGAEITMEVKGKFAERGLSEDMELRTGVNLTTREDNRMSGFPFRQEAAVPEGRAQRIVLSGLARIEETTDWRSGVINKGNTYPQRLVLHDDARVEEDFVVGAVRLKNLGTLDDEDVENVSVYREGEDGNLILMGEGVTLSGDWRSLEAYPGGRIPFGGQGTFEIHYEISPGAQSGATLQPEVQFRGREGEFEEAVSPVYTMAEPLTIYPGGAEIIEASRRPPADPATHETDGILAQRIDMMDRDENRFDVLVNPIVIKNLATATEHDFRKLELFDSTGELLYSTTDLSGLTTAGITLDDLRDKTRIPDSFVGNWRSFFIYLTPRSGREERTVNLQTTLYQTEGDQDYVAQVTGPEFVTGGQRVPAAGTIERLAPEPEVETPALNASLIALIAGAALLGWFLFF